MIPGLVRQLGSVGRRRIIHAELELQQVLGQNRQWLMQIRAQCGESGDAAKLIKLSAALSPPLTPPALNIPHP